MEQQKYICVDTCTYLEIDKYIHDTIRTRMVQIKVVKSLQGIYKQVHLRVEWTIYSIKEKRRHLDSYGRKETNLFSLSTLCAENC